MFGFPDLVEGSQKTLELVTGELDIIYALWDHIDETNVMLDGFLSTKWDEVNCDSMEDNVK